MWFISISINIRCYAERWSWDCNLFLHVSSGSAVIAIFFCRRGFCIWKVAALAINLRHHAEQWRLDCDLFPHHYKFLWKIYQSTQVLQKFGLCRRPQRCLGLLLPTTGHTIDTFFMPSFMISNLVEYSHMFKATKTKTKDTSLFGGVVIVWLDPSQYYTA